VVFRWWAVTSGELGQVTLHHVDHEMESELEDGARWEVAPAVPHPDPPVIHLDPHDLPDGPVQLVVARGGRVVVLLEDDRGEPITGDWIHLQVARDDRDALGRWIRPRRHDRLTRDGVAVFEPVAPGLELQASAYPHGFRPVEEIHPGPAAVGLESTIRLRLLEPYPTITGTLVDTTGEPVADRPMDLRVYFVPPSERDRREVSDRFRTDGRGRFRSIARVPRATDPLKELLFTTDEAYEGPTLEARVSLGGQPQERTVDLGEVVLHAPSVIASGRVVDAQGEPLYWAGIWVRRMREPDDPPGPRFTPVHELQTQTDRDGRFELTGELPAGDYRIDAAKEGYLRRTEIPVQHGMRGIEIVLLREGGLKGDLILREGVSPSWLRVEFLENDADSDRYGSWGRDLVIPHPDGTFFLPGLEPGTYDLEVVVPSWRTPLVRVEDVSVESGINRTDPKLTGLDLRNRLHRIDTEVIGPEGEPVPLGYATFAPDGGEETRIAFTDGAAVLLSATLSIDVELLAPGYRPLRIGGVIDGARLTLERGLPVRLKLPESLQPPEPPLSLWAELSPRNQTRREPNPGVYSTDGDRVDLWRDSQAGDRAPFDDRGEALLHAGEAGTWTLRWRIERADQDWSSGVPHEEGYPQMIEVGERGFSEPIEVCPDVEELRSLLESLED